MAKGRAEVANRPVAAVGGWAGAASQQRGYSRVG